MRTTINLDDELLAQAQLLSGLTKTTQLLHEALLALVQRESARRLAKLGSTQAQFQFISRRRNAAA